MFCKFCGSKIDDDSIFCAHCGKQLNNIKASSNNIAAETPKAVTDPENNIYHKVTIFRESQSFFRLGVIGLNRFNLTIDNESYFLSNGDRIDLNLTEDEHLLTVSGGIDKRSYIFKVTENTTISIRLGVMGGLKVESEQTDLMPELL